MKKKLQPLREVFPFVVFVWLILVGLGFLREYYSIVVFQQVEVSAIFLLVRAFINSSIVMLYILGVYHLAMAAPLHGGNWTNLKWHIPVLLLALLVIPAWDSIVYFWIRGDMPNPFPLDVVYSVHFRYKILVLPFLHTFIVIGQWLLTTYREQLVGEAQALKSRSELVRSKLNVLKARINPHFLFNTLQGVSSLAYSDREAAHSMLVSLRELFHKVDERIDRALVRLEEEIAFNRHFLYLERRRFRNKLDVDIRVEEKCNSVRVPKFILQPLIENSIKHVLVKSLEEATVRIRCFGEQGYLFMTVEDSGLPGADTDRILKKLKKGDFGYGLGNIYDRLAVIGNGASLQFSLSPLGGLRSTVRLPADL